MTCLDSSLFFAFLLCIPRLFEWNDDQSVLMVCVYSSSETTENKDRWRRLEGQDSRPEELRRKVVKLEHRLNQKKEQVLEKNLLLDQLTRASDKIRSKALDERDATLDVAKEMNSYQARLRKTTKAMMATVAELSMYQATAMKLEAERREKVCPTSFSSVCFFSPPPCTYVVFFVSSENFSCWFKFKSL